MRKNGSQLLQSIFDVNHPFWLTVERCFSVFLLNICFVVTCLPIVTYGIARLALYSSLIELKHHGKIAVLSTYFGKFKKHWKLGLQIGLIEELIVGFCLIDLWITSSAQLFPIQILRLVCFAVIIFTQMVSPYLYFLGSKQDLHLSHLGKATIILASRQLGLTMIILVVFLGLLFVTFFNTLSFLLTLSILAVFGYATLAYLFIANCKY